MQSKLRPDACYVVVIDNSQAHHFTIDDELREIRVPTLTASWLREIAEQSELLGTSARPLPPSPEPPELLQPVAATRRQLPILGNDGPLPRLQPAYRDPYA